MKNIFKSTAMIILLVTIFIVVGCQKTEKLSTNTQDKGANAKQTLSEGGSKPTVFKPVVMETKYPTADIPIANYNVTAFGAKGDGRTDDTKAFQDALNKAKEAGGGVVFAPAGEYTILGNLTVPNGVTLRGDWRNPEDSTTSGIGTLLKAYKGKGSTEGAALITLAQSAGLTNMAIWYPEQDYTNIQPYPWTIKQANGCSMTVENVTLFNSYQGIKVGPEFNELHLIRNVYGTPLKTGISRERTTDVGRLQVISFRPKYWAESGLPGAPSDKETENILRKWIEENGEGIICADPNWLFIYDITLENYKIGFRFTPSLDNSGKRGPNGGLYKLNIFDGAVGLQFEGINPNGIAVVDSTIKASKGSEPVAVLTMDKFKSIIQFNKVTFGGKPHTAVKLQGDKGLISFVDCTFEDWGYNGGNYAIDVINGAIQVTQNTFNKAGKHIYLSNKTTGALILNNQFAGVPQIINDSPSTADIQISNESVQFAKIKENGYISKKTLPKPTSNQLYNVKDYNAKGNGQDDDTAAIQAALDAAGKTGGTVYVPAGKYRLNAGIQVPSGVELRGSFDVQHHTRNNEGTQFIVYAGKNEIDGTPLIKLAKDAGIRGVTIYYPEQVWNTTNFVPYPWTIQGQGPGVWAKDVVLVNPYQGIDFGTYDSTGHFIDYVSGSPLVKGIFIGNNSGEGWVQNIQFIPHYWGRSSYANIPEKSETLRLNTIQTLDAMIFGYNANEQILHTFVYGTNIGIHFVNQEGLGATSGNVIGHGTDGTETSMQMDDIGDCEFVNTQLVAMTSEALKRHLVIKDTVKGTARFFNTILWGNYVDRSMQIDGGNIMLQQTSYRTQGDMAAHITGGTLILANNYFQVGGKNVYVGPGVKEARIIGSACAGNEGPAVNFVNEAGSKTSIQYNISKNGK